MSYPKSIQNLVDFFKELPSVGPKTAERYVFHLLKKPEHQLKLWATFLSELKEKTKSCSICHTLSSESPCAICSDEKRSPKLLCLVESVQDLAALEATKQYSGRYFVLGGLIDTINNVGPEDLNIVSLVKRLKTGDIKEIIVALNFTLEGEASFLYLNKILKDFPEIKVTRLARGLPAGSNLEYADESTLASALKNRNQI